TGGSTIVKNFLRPLYFPTGGYVSPCPVCGGVCASDNQKLCTRDEDCTPGDTCLMDAAANDGLRGGTCDGGLHRGKSCDVGAINTSFPVRANAPGGAGYSLDCDVDSGRFLYFAEDKVVESTGTSSLPATVTCNLQHPENGLCPCGMCAGETKQCHEDADCPLVCSKNSNRSCNGNSDCIDGAADLGPCQPATCSADGDYTWSRNFCIDGLCTLDDAGNGACTNGPDERFCDALLKADGRGVRNCGSNGDCTLYTEGDLGNCSL